ncbi:uncharacterized protein [Temnothorax nylanderi]|uniref:uncharacterized protein n=1 Tax=Temnothorax nylanderi TaxID=102681 RepID=UPI003A87C2E8
MISKSSSNQVSSNDITIKNLLSEQQLLESQVWLKSYTEPWTEVLERWKKTAPNRIAQFTKRKDLSITNILTEWPLFKHPLGYSLISIDFTVLFPEKGLKFLNGWPSCRDKLIDIIRERSNKNKHTIAYQILNTLPSVISEDGKDIVAMYLLPILLPPAIIREKDKGSWKPTIAEAQETFVLYVKDSVSKQIFLEQRKEKYQKLMRPIQPCVIIVGETLQTAKDFYVLFENVEYKLSSVLGAVDTCFKVIHVMNLVGISTRSV